MDNIDKHDAIERGRLRRPAARAAQLKLHGPCSCIQYAIFVHLHRRNLCIVLATARNWHHGCEQIRPVGTGMFWMGSSGNGAYAGP